MKKVILLLLALSLVSIEASAQFKRKKKKVTEENTEEAAYAKAKAVKSDGKHFGDNITPDGAMDCKDLLTKMDVMSTTSAPIETKVRGTVQAVCQNKGCWIRLSGADADKTVFVKFKDYAFFMPFDLAGQQVVMQGKAYVSETPVAELRHYAEDAGKSKEEIEKINAPEKNFKFTASGVVILDK